MAKFKDSNAVTKGLSGKFDNVLVFRQRAGKTYIGKIPVAHSGEFTDKQLNTQEKFMEGAAYAKSAMANPVTKALYEAATPIGQSAYNVALGDYCSSPKIKQVDVTGYKGVIGDIIMVKATDNFMVKSVKLTIEKLDGTLIETGDAVQDAMNGNKWNFTAAVANAVITGIKVIAEAKDLPGNSTTNETVIP